MMKVKLFNNRQKLSIHKDNFRIVFHDRRELEATLDECKGLERFMVWEAANIEKRISIVNADNFHIAVLLEFLQQMFFFDT